MRKAPSATRLSQSFLPPWQIAPSSSAWSSCCTSLWQETSTECKRIKCLEGVSSGWLSSPALISFFVSSLWTFTQKNNQQMMYGHSSSCTLTSMHSRDLCLSHFKFVQSELSGEDTCLLSRVHYQWFSSSLCMYSTSHGWVTDYLQVQLRVSRTSPTLTTHSSTCLCC